MKKQKRKYLTEQMLINAQKKGLIANLKITNDTITFKPIKAVERINCIINIDELKWKRINYIEGKELVCPYCNNVYRGSDYTYIITSMSDDDYGCTVMCNNCHKVFEVLKRRNSEDVDTFKL